MSRAGVVDRLVSRVSIYPFRCQVCARKFYAFTWGERYVRRPQDQREYDRVAVTLDARLVSCESERPAHVTSLSLGGCSVETDLRTAEGSGIRLQIGLSDSERPLTIDGAVIRWARHGMFGLEFVRMAASEKARLRAFVLGGLGLREEQHAALAAGLARRARRRRVRATVLLLLTALVAVVLVAMLMPTFSLCMRGPDC